MIQVMYLHTPASPLDAGALLCSSPPFGEAALAESQLEVLDSQLGTCIFPSLEAPEFPATGLLAMVECRARIWGGSMEAEAWEHHPHSQGFSRVSVHSVGNTPQQRAQRMV